MIKKILLFSCLFACFTFASSTVQAQRIAHVDINKILDSDPAYTKAQEDLDKLASRWRRQIAEEYDKIRGMYNRYQAEQVLMSEETRKQKQDEIEDKEKAVREMQKQKFGPEGELFKKRQELVRPIQDKVYKAIEEFASDKGFDYVFDKGSNAGMIYSSERYDKTNDILKILGL